MPSRNRIKCFVPETYYHIYNRGVEKRTIFIDDTDYIAFLGILERYLSPTSLPDAKQEYEYECFATRVELLAFCLMGNHFHLLAYQRDALAITQLLHKICTSYTGYFNRRHRRVGPLFQDRFRAVEITNDAYLLHISRYIHLNPRDYQKWPWSSYSYYISRTHPIWMKPDRMTKLFEDGASYASFVADYKQNHDMLEELKHGLADS